ncbi:hypothetical protein MVLG_00142 [Microbotryum lychnidis-dioicae p1A1 Lamole]|uniref:Uncharacterized protein n=1 Tax=Microbotryum lychnidis-dioicae (strain p1A1 Lamole / MvSl-1064) TaxID=683840 RepID=U5GY73_USTV1|nr:hypothetical protein MVLG_00142 [Microbotryum lychnidis-dioicae p1A1 Lamole]|eukprot:KDE09742.1 hypothetical protein MVLG_00142 [Microbotryum lychnidis-dioicae p1A1 Lamole]
MVGAKPSRWRRALCVFVTLLALFLLGTVVVLTTVVEYFGVDWRDVITEPEMLLYERLAREAAATQAVLANSGAAQHQAKGSAQAVVKSKLAFDDDISAEDDEPSVVRLVEGADSQPEALASIARSDNGDGALPDRRSLNAEASHPLARHELATPTTSTAAAEASLAAAVGDFERSLKTKPTPRIPRIIHATWKTDVVPQRWLAARQGCMDMHPDYEFKLWSDAASREFIATHYAWFLAAFDGYTYPIQRADAIRYFVLHRFGGIYMDLDVGCKRPLDPLLYYQVVLPATIPVGVSNDIMFSEKGHPFMDNVIRNLLTFNHQYGTNYPTVMFSTGPMFLSAQYGLWPKEDLTLAERQVRVLPRRWYGKNAPANEIGDSFFEHFYGSSWHADDAGFITFLGKFGMLLMYLGATIVVWGVGRMMWGKRFGMKKPVPKSGRTPGPIALPLHLDGSSFSLARPSTPGSARPDSPLGGSRSGSPSSSRRPSEIGPQGSRGVLYYLPVWLMPQDAGSRTSTPTTAGPGTWSQLFYSDDEEANRYSPIPSYSRPPSPSNNSILHAPGSMHDGAFNGTPLSMMHANDESARSSEVFHRASLGSASSAPPPDYSNSKGWSSFFRSPRASFLPLTGQQQQHNSEACTNGSAHAIAAAAIPESFVPEHPAGGTLSPLYTASFTGPFSSPTGTPQSTSPSSKHAAEQGDVQLGRECRPTSDSSATTFTTGSGELQGRGMVRSNSGGISLGNSGVATVDGRPTTTTSLEAANAARAAEAADAQFADSSDDHQQHQHQHQHPQPPQQQQAFTVTPTRVGALESESDLVGPDVDREVHRLLHDMTPDLARPRARDN